MISISRKHTKTTQTAQLLIEQVKPAVKIHINTAIQWTAGLPETENKYIQALSTSHKHILKD